METASAEAVQQQPQQESAASVATSGRAEYETSFMATQQAQLSRWGLWLRNFWPASAKLDAKELLRMAAGVALGLLVTGLLSQWWAPDPTTPWLVSSLGASAVLLFGMPSSPLAQPWPVLGGTIVSALAGGFSQWLVPDPTWATALAVGLSILLMVPLRCMHPPGAGFAAYVVLEHVNGMALVPFPIFFNVLILVLCAVIYNALTGRRYPHPQHSLHPHSPKATRFAPSDLDAALAHYNQVLDISRADLEGLLHRASKAAFQRTLGDLRCKDLMSRPAYAVEAGVALSEAWELMQQEQVKALPVVDAAHHVVGLLSTSDFLKLGPWSQESLVERIKHMVPWTERKPKLQKVADIMTGNVECAQPESLALELLPIFASKSIRHIPIVNAQGVLVGVVTQTDLLKAFSKSLLENG